MTASLAPAGPLAAPFLAYLRLEVRRSLRNRRYLLFTIAFPLILYVLYTSVIPADSTGEIGGLAWPAYFLVSMAAYGAIGAAMSQAAPIATERRTGWARQLRVTPLPGIAYVAAKVVGSVIVTVPALALVATAGSLVNHLDVSVVNLVAMVAVLAIASLPFAALGLLLGYLLDVESAQGGMVLTFFGLAILGGLFAPLEAFPDGLATMARVLPSSHFASLGRSVLAGRLPDALDIVVVAAWALVISAAAAWRYRVDERAGRA
jgi:ABC-2 type transport system permease protein